MYGIFRKRDPLQFYMSRNTHVNHANQLDREYQGRVGRDDTSKPTRTVCHVRWDGQGALLIEAHADQSLVPASDDLAHTECQWKGVGTVKTRVEFISIGEKGSCIVNLNTVSLFSLVGTLVRFECCFNFSKEEIFVRFVLSVVCY